MTTVARELDVLSQQIIAALQVNSRASWRAIAAVLDQPERTVARRGMQLLAHKLVKVRALPVPRRTHGADQYVFRARCTPGTAGIAARALAARAETLFSYVLVGSVDCAADLSCPPDRLADLVISELGALPGLSETTTYPVLRYFRTMHEWRPAGLSTDQIAALEGEPGPDRLDTADRVELDPVGRAVLRALCADGRAPYEEVSRLAGVSLQTARRRAEQMRRDGVYMLRAVFEPALMGLSTEALLWVRAPYPEIDVIGDELLDSQAVRYAALLAGDYQLLIDVVVRDRNELYEYLRQAPWTTRAHSIEPTLVVEVLKRSGVSTRAEAQEELA